MIIYGPVVIVLDETCWSFLAPGTSCVKRPANAAMGNWGTCLVCPKHMEQLRTNWANISDCGICVLMFCPTNGLDMTWLLAPTWHTVPIRDKVYLKGSTPKWSTSEHRSPSTDALLQCLTGERESTSQASSSKINQSNIPAAKVTKNIHGTSPTHFFMSFFFLMKILSYLSWSCGTSPAESFMTLPLPAGWSLTKVCPVELRSTMDTFKGSTSAKVPGVSFVVPRCSLPQLDGLFHGKS